MREKIAGTIVKANKESAPGVGMKAFVAVLVGKVMDAMERLVVRQGMNVLLKLQVNAVFLRASTPSLAHFIEITAVLYAINEKYFFYRQMKLKTKDCRILKFEVEPFVLLTIIIDTVHFESWVGRNARGMTRAPLRGSLILRFILHPRV